VDSCEHEQEMIAVQLLDK